MKISNLRIKSDIIFHKKTWVLLPTISLSFDWWYRGKSTLKERSWHLYFQFLCVHVMIRFIDEGYKYVEFYPTQKMRDWFKETEARGKIN